MCVCVCVGGGGGGVERNGDKYLNIHLLENQSVNDFGPHLSYFKRSYKKKIEEEPLKRCLQLQQTLL